MDPSNGSGTLQFSEEAQRRIEQAEARAEAAERRAEELGETVGRLSDVGKASDVKAFLDSLRGMDLDEKHGQTAFLNEVSAVMLADDQGPAVVSEQFSEDGKSEVSLTLSEAIKRIFGALKLGEDGKLGLDLQLEQPSEKREGEEKPDGKDGKPPRDESDKDDEFSIEGAAERAAEFAEKNPELAAIAPVSRPKKDDEGGDR